MRFSGKTLPSVIGASFVLILSFLFFIDAPLTRSVMDSMQNWAYDLQVKYSFQPPEKEGSIAIIDIDDKSIAALGKWPWTRNKLANLVDQARINGAKVVAFDIAFTEPEKNIVDEVAAAMAKTNEGGSATQALDAVRATFAYDAQFAASLRAQPSVLSMFFLLSDKREGILPLPALTLSKEMAKNLGIPEEKGYLADIEVLQQAAKYGGFSNATPDRDGILRFSPLLLRYGNDVFASLALSVASLYLGARDIALITQDYEGVPVLEGIQLGDQTIPTDPWGRILIPFRGPASSFPYISAVDFLNGKVARDKIENKILFVSSTAIGIGDEAPTAIAPEFPGVEIHASIASGILDSYLPFRPAWGKGVTLSILLGLGLFCAFGFPRLTPISLTVTACALLVSLIAAAQWMWTHELMVISLFFPAFAVLVLAVFNFLYEYLSEDRQRKEMKLIFGQYVPPEYIEIMLKKGETSSLEGESREMSVLFSDIVGFTHMSENMSAQQLKGVLNQYLTPMTEVIFNHHGTIDKYVGDMIVAFWGAPLENPKHAFSALETAWQMQQKLKELNVVLKRNAIPEIRVGIGVNTGIMNVGDMGSKFRRAYTVISDAVNTGSRLEALTRLYEVGIIVGEETWKQTKEEFLFRKLDRVKVKGKERAIDIFQPLCYLKDASEGLFSEVKIHDRALECYSKQDWDEAEKLFGQLQKSTSENRPNYEVYLERIQAYRANPPPSDWTGEYILEHK